jgi:N-acylneuraminate cytidylyltransferase
MFAYIPARGGSKRIPRKNVRPLHGKPVLARVIENLKPLDFLSAIYVSTDDPEIAAVAQASGATYLKPRAADLSNDKAGFMDLIRDDLPNFMEAEGGDEEVLFVLPTAALVPTDIYREAYEVWREMQPDILMSCETCFPWWAMTQKPDGFWSPIFPDKVTTNSQDLPPSLIDAGLFYYFRQSEIKAFATVKSADRVMPFMVPDDYIGDIDNPEDWDLLEYRLARLEGRA